MEQEQRKQYLVDKKLQLGLAMRLLSYWMATWLVVFCVPILVRTFTSELTFGQLASSLIDDFWFPMVISAILLPVVARDCIRFSNRIAGPMLRLQRVMSDLVDDREVEPVKCRKDDLCVGLADEFNRLVAKSIQAQENNQLSHAAGVSVLQERNTALHTQ